ncbi:Ig-like domain-containing protein [Kosakonia sp. H02]|nr:Ig-like domain-containing protein [Kosakonia sp. H02]
MKTIQLPGWMRRTAWGIILLQLFSPLLLSVTPMARATEYEDYRNMNETMSGLQALVNEPRMLTHPSPPPDIPPPQPLAQSLPDLGSENDAVQNDVNSATPEQSLAPKLAQAGQVLMSKDMTNSSLNLARSLGEGIVNQQINDWMDNKGSVNASLGSDGAVTGDLLVPLLDNENQLLFGQLGLRKNDERNIANIGLGYRQQIGRGMYGVNTFYDYDYTGKNARLGVGGEAWADYLKMSVNAYYGLTDWHPSSLDKMKDYDERPANGFDVRLDGWLPSHPQWGGTLKYERYFGKDIALASSGDLKNDPYALTLGLNYSPFPLLTLSGERSFGDSHDTRFDLALNYRLGVPLWRQLDADNVDIQRSLIGSKYALVDRNYNIVMQYRKQLLVALSVPQHFTVEAGSTLRIPVTVTKAKYGLKRIEWRASANFTANGGRWHQPSMTALDVQVPAYVTSRSRAVSAPQDYVLTAIGEDENGNRGDPVTTIIHVTRSSIVVEQLDVTPNTAQLANNQDAFTIAAKVVNRDGQPVSGQRLTFRVSQLTDSNNVSAATLFTASASDKGTLDVDTNNQGIATVKLKSRVVGNGVITAALRNGNDSSARVAFIADVSSARLADLAVITNNAVADGVKTNELRATVKDRYGNPLANYAVSFTADNGATLVGGNIALTDAQGHALLSLTHTRAVTSTITANVNGVTLSKPVAFVVDRSTAHFVHSSVTQNALANGIDGNVMQVKVADALGNPLPGMAIQFVPGIPVNVTLAQALTDAQGEAKTTLTSRRAGSFNATAKLVGTRHTAQVRATFMPDGNTAQLPDENLVISPDGALANGIATNGVTATVVDANDNPISGVAVSFSASNGATLAATSGVTGADGQVRTTVVSNKAGVYTVNATVNGRVISKSTVFVADAATAQITDANLVVDTNDAVANGTAVNGITAIVTDAKGNRLSGVRVEFIVSAGAVLSSAQGLSDQDGKVTTRVTSLRAGRYTVTAKVAATTPSKEVNFIADTATATITSVLLDGGVIDKNANASDNFIYKATVKDANNNPVSGLPVHWVQDKGATVNFTSQSVTDSAGVAAVVLQSTYQEALAVQVAASLSNANYINADKKVNFNAQLVTVRGVVKDAVSGGLLSGGEVRFFKALGDAQPAYLARSDSYGNYSINIKQGTYHMHASYGRGYIAVETPLDASVLGITDYTKSFALSPVLNGKAARIVLTWDALPRDLDSHLFVPVGSGTKHVQYSDRKPAGADAELDIDNTKGYGPETITINTMHPGSYCYTVQRYSLESTMASAKVNLYLSDGRTFSWAVENATGSLSYRNWYVFKINVDQNLKVDVQPVSTLTNNSNLNGC